MADRLDVQPGKAPFAGARLGKNLNGYFGETIDVLDVLDESLAAAAATGWDRENIPVGSTEPAQEEAFRSGARNLFLHHLVSLKRRANATAGEPVRIYISAGIHGDEPAGPLAIRQLLQEDNWPDNAELWLCPCLNPEGYLCNRRENAFGIDLNRDYLDLRTAEIRAHVQWLERQPAFDVCFCLHEDWESHGFYLYELNPDGKPSLAEGMVDAVARVCPIDHSEIIEGRPARNGVIRPGADPLSRPQWPEAFFLLTHKTRLSYTLEAPSDFPLAMRVASLVTAVTAGLDSFASGSRHA